MAACDPYATLGVTPTATEAEIRSAYRRLVQRHHPDHNGGSRESALRFAEVQEAYAHVKLLRQREAAAGAAGGTAGRTSAAEGTAGRTAAGRGAGGAGSSGAAGTAGTAGTPRDPAVEERIAAMERELRAARERREQAARAAERARAEAARAARAAARATTRAAGADPARPSDEELGYVRTEDSFSKIFDDLADQVSARFAETRDVPRATPGKRPRPRAPQSVADWIDELGARLTGERPDSRKRTDDGK